MSSDASNFYEQWPNRFAKAKAAAPDAVKGFAVLFGAVMKEGALSVREKELIALAIGMGKRT